MECFVLMKLNGGILAWLTAVPWFYFFVSAALLQSTQLSRGYRKNLDDSPRLDIISGEFPTTGRPGGECRILLGTPINFRHHTQWRIIWAIGAAVVLTWFIACYIVLPSRPTEAVYVWVGFQVLWVFCRSLFFHVAEETDTFIRPTVTGRKWGNLSCSLKTRLLELLFAHSKYQMFVHPRRGNSYLEDVAAFDEVRSLLASSTLTNQYELHETESLHPSIASGEKTIDLKIHAIIGDTLISSAAWFQGSKYTPMDLYDCCVVFLEIPPIMSETHSRATTGRKLLAIPAVRPLGAALPVPRIVPRDIELGDSGNDGHDFDELEIHRHSSPKGTQAILGSTEWYCWIPCTRDRWIQVTSSQMKMVGVVMKAQVITSDHLTETLRAGTLNISLDGVDAVRNVIELSRHGASMIVDLFGSI
jgi:hypothetical protein